MMARSEYISDKEFYAIAFFAIGAASEAKEKAYSLVLAGNEYDKNGRVLNEGGRIAKSAEDIVRIKPAGNSGYSFGMLQNDLGQREYFAEPMVREAQQWARATRFHLQIDNSEIKPFSNELSRQGEFIKNVEHGKPLTHKLQTIMNGFLASERGIAFAHACDIRQATIIRDTIFNPLTKTKLYQESNYDDKIRLVTVTAKLYNQSMRNGKNLLREIEHGQHNNLQSVYNRIDAYNPKEGRSDYLETGRKHALAGAETFIALNHTHPDNPLHQKWARIKQDPLKLPTSRHGQERKDYDEILSLFFNTNEGLRLIRQREKEIQNMDVLMHQPEGSRNVLEKARAAFASPGMLFARMQETLPERQPEKPLQTAENQASREQENDAPKPDPWSIDV